MTTRNKMPRSERDLTAWHEAGHFVAGWAVGRQPCGVEVYESERNGVCGRTLGSGEKVLFDDEEMCVFAAGYVAELVAEGHTCDEVARIIDGAFRDTVEEVELGGGFDGGDLVNMGRHPPFESYPIFLFRRNHGAADFFERRELAAEAAWAMVKGCWKHVTQVHDILMERGKITKREARKLYNSWFNDDDFKKVCRKVNTSLTKVIGPLIKIEKFIEESKSWAIYRDGGLA